MVHSLILDVSLYPKRTNGLRLSFSTREAIVPPKRTERRLRAPIAQIPCLDFPSAEVPDSHDLVITRNHVQSLVAPFSIFTFNVQHQPFDRPLDPDADCVTPSADAVPARRGSNGRNVKFERHFSGRRERKVFIRFWPEIAPTSVSSGPPRRVCVCFF